jgi:hypothetical protein
VATWEGMVDSGLRGEMYIAYGCIIEALGRRDTRN